MNSIVSMVIMICLAITCLFMEPESAIAQGGYSCVFGNDHVYGSVNTVDGYLVTSTSQIYLSPVETGGESDGFSFLQDLVMNPTRRILYVSNALTGDVAAMKITPQTCALTLLDNYSIGEMSRGGTGLVISPNVKWLYVANASKSTITLANIRPDGSLSSPSQVVSLPSTPSGLQISPDGASLIMAVERHPRGVNEALSYSVDPDTGKLTPVSILNTYESAGPLAIDAQSQNAYMTATGRDGDLRIIQLTIGQASTLTIKRFYDFAEVPAFATGSALISTNGKLLYVTNPQEATVVTFKINSTGGDLQYVTSSNDGMPPDDQPMGLASSKNGQLVFTGEVNPYGANLGILAAGKDGSLTALGTFPLAGTLVAWIVAVNF